MSTNKNEFSEFDAAGKELDKLTGEGTFGDKAKLLASLRNTLPDTDFYLECFKNIFDSTDLIFKSNIAGIGLKLMKIIGLSYQKSPQETIDLITAFFKGPKEHPELENISSYTEFIESNAQYKSYFSRIKGQSEVSSSEKRQLARLLIDTYTKGVEFASKVFSLLISLQNLAASQPAQYYENTFLPLYQKILSFEKAADDDCKMLTSVIDRQIRNAASHLNIYYSTERSVFIITDIQGMKKAKTSKTIEVSLKKMLLDVFPRVGWFAQGFFASCMMLYLAQSGDEEKYRKAQHLMQGL